MSSQQSWSKWTRTKLRAAHRTARQRSSHLTFRPHVETLEARRVFANDFLAGTAFVDSNSNGVLDTTEAYLPNATIELRSGNGTTLLATDVTDAKGAFSFTGLAPGNYKLVNLSAPGFNGSDSQALSQLNPATEVNAVTIDVTLLNTSDLQAVVDTDTPSNPDSFFESGLWELLRYKLFGVDDRATGGQFPLELTSASISGGSVGPFLSLCTNLFEFLNLGVNTYDVTPGAAPIGSGAPHNGDRIAFLYNHYGLTALPTDGPHQDFPQYDHSIQAGGLQVAVYELLYDNTTVDADGDLDAGNFQLLPTTPYHAQIKSAAQTYLTASVGKSEAAIFLNADPPENAGGKQGMIATGSYNFANQPSQSVHPGQTATIGFWQNKNGQKLLKSLNGGPSSTALGNWLAATFPNMFGAAAGSSNLKGKTNAYIADFYVKKRFSVSGQKLDAQVMAVAFAVYVTDSDLAGTVARSYGFEVNSTGTGAAKYNVGSNGAAFGVPNNTQLTVLQILLITDSLAFKGKLWDVNDNGSISTSEQSLRNKANTVFSGINETGDI